MRKTVVSTSEQAHYWHKLWLGMGTEFARTQDILVEEIDRLRRVAGEYDGRSFLDNQFQKSFRDNWVTPEKHPANKRVAVQEGLNVNVPPKKPDELIAEAERDALPQEAGDVA